MRLADVFEIFRESSHSYENVRDEAACFDLAERFERDDLLQLRFESFGLISCEHSLHVVGMLLLFLFRCFCRISSPSLARS